MLYTFRKKNVNFKVNLNKFATSQEINIIKTIFSLNLEN